MPAEARRLFPGINGTKIYLHMPSQSKKFAPLAKQFLSQFQSKLNGNSSLENIKIIRENDQRDRPINGNGANGNNNNNGANGSNNGPPDGQRNAGGGGGDRNGNHDNVRLLL